jgi:TatD DNase family protein
MQIVDTHCHIHFDDFGFEAEAVIEAAEEAKVTKMICVGCTLADSARAVEFANRYDNVWASVGAHPHDGADFLTQAGAVKTLEDLVAKPKVVAIGEIGLDYYRSQVPKEDQIKSLRTQIEATIDAGLPYIFHIREAFTDIWNVLDSYSGVKGVIHSFSSNVEDLDQALTRGFYIGLNGIMTFTKDEAQLAAAQKVPLDKLMLETDAPFLTPAPFRGTTCEPKHTAVTAKFLADLRGEKLEDLTAQTTSNAERLFRI